MDLHGIGEIQSDTCSATISIGYSDETKKRRSVGFLAGFATLKLKHLFHRTCQPIFLVITYTRNHGCPPDLASNGDLGRRSHSSTQSIAERRRVLIRF